MKFKNQGRKKRLEIEARRAALKMILAVLGVLTFGLVSWLLLGRPHRHGRRWHWNKDVGP